MIRVLAILLLATSAFSQDATQPVPPSGETALGPGDYRWIPFTVHHPPTEVHLTWQVLSGGPTVHAELMPGSEFRFFRGGREHDSMTTTPDARSGEIRQIVIDPGRYAVVLSNRDDAAPVTLSMHFETNMNPGADVSRTLSPLRRLTVIVVSLAVFLGMVSWSIRSLWHASRYGRADARYGREDGRQGE